MRAALAKRLDALEPRSPVVAVPNVVTVQHDETAADALARFGRDYAGRIPARHGVVVLPERIATPEAEADFATRFFEQQTTLIATARSARPKDEFND